ncbi:14061_t:CDS:1 [Ambispora leptoticha]|uniref:14061_t:CDS:1 n=1 Tax=Ambispora leptoticha TaxID=144679 RepID=A0A9N9BUI4_9GLOM|nr:14061_t:CDS:1 [Ambispora leptoticha]
MFKNTLATLSLLLVICLTFLHAYPIALEVGDKASVTLSKLDGKITFTQIDPTNLEVDGQFNKGITDDNADDYSICIEDSCETFAELGVVIKVPGTEPFKATGPGLIEIIDGKTLSVKHNDDTIDSGVITKN